MKPYRKQPEDLHEVG